MLRTGRKLFLRNFVLFILPLLIPISFLGFFSITLTQRFLRDGIDQSSLRLLTQTRETIEVVFSELDSQRINFNLNAGFISKLKLLLDKDVIDFNEQETYDAFVNYMNFINPPVNAKPYLDSIYVYLDNDRGNFLASNQNIAHLDTFYDTSWYDSYLAMPAKADFMIEVRDIRKYPFEKEKTHFLTVYAKLYMPGLADAQGIIVMNIKRDYIEGMLQGLASNPDQSILLLDSRGDPIVGANDESLDPAIVQKLDAEERSSFSLAVSGKTYMVNQIISSKYGLKYLLITPASSLYRLPTQLTYLSILLVFLSLLLGVFFIYLLNRRNYQNLTTIMETFQSAEAGTPIPALPSRIKDEYSYILNNLVRTFIEQSYLKVQLSEKRYRLRTMELMALQSQINPHFLTNTLRAIFWKSIGAMGRQNDVSRMIEYLSSVLQYSLSNCNEMVTLDEEIENTKSYIEIQKMRYKDKFLVDWQYNAAIGDRKVMKLLLQPLIENSIYHGIKEKDCPGLIRIRMSVKDERLRITIADNGAGMDKARFEEVLRRLEEQGEVFEHIGLLNTYRRLRLIYGEGLHFRIQSRHGKGTVVHLSFPIIDRPEPCEET